MLETSRNFMDDDFLLDTPAARYLYHNHAAKLPIIDYHCHLSPRMIAEDKPFASITDLWLGGDHYKWRAMRANGEPERCITGDGRKPYHTLSVILCITGRILNCARHSESMIY